MHFSREKPSYPEVPSSLNYNSYEMHNVQLNNDNNSSNNDDNWKQHKYDTAGSVTPYLGLRARLSQIWINRWTVLLILVLVRVLILVGGLHDDIGDAEAQALQACTKVEDVGSAMASMPHYLSVGVNSLAADGITKTVHGMVKLLMMILTGVEQLILFVINMYIGTYVCLSTALIHGTLDVGIGAAGDVADTMNKAIGTISDGLSDDLKSVQDVINKAFEQIADVASTFGKDLNPPTIDVSGRLDDLKNIKVDTSSFVSTLKSLNSTIPTYDEAENFTRNAIAQPFDLVKQMLNKTYGSYEFDTNVFPTAKKEALTFCSDNNVISDFFKGLFELADKAKVIFLVVLILLAILACVPMTWIEIRRYRSQLQRARTLTEHGYDPMDVVYIASRPYTAGAGIRLAGGATAGSKRQLLTRWAVAYGTSFPALFVLSLALAGFFSCLCQAILMASVKKEAPALTNQVSDFAANVVNTLESVSTDWANDANGVLLGFQGDVNNDVLGYVTNATTAVNNTLNTFTEEIDKGITAAFNGTVLDNTVRQIVRCLIGLKIEAVEQGLTWVHDNAQITLPLFPNNTFSAGANDSIGDDSSLTSFLASPSSVTTDEITAAVDKVVSFLRNSLIQEALISTGLLLLYVIVVLIGVVWAVVSLIKPERTRAEGGQQYYGPDTAPTAVANNNSSTTNNYNNQRPISAVTTQTVPPYFPRFGPESANVDDATAASRHDEKMSQVQPQTVPSGYRGETKAAHYRQSSYGDVDDAGR